MCNLIICSPGTVCSLFEVIVDYRHIFEAAPFCDSPGDIDEQLMLLHSQNICKIVAKKPIIIYPKGYCGCGDSEAFAVLMNSSFNNSADKICSPQLITCGVCDDDVVTFSSFSTEQAVVSLQKSIRTISGRVVGARDFPIKLQSEKSTKSQFDILALSALLILCDRCDMLETLLF